MIESVVLLIFPWLIALMVISCWGIVLLLAIVLVSRALMPRRAVMRTVGTLPALSQRIISSHGYLALDCSLSALTYRQMAASEAMAVYEQCRQSRAAAWVLAALWLYITFTVWDNWPFTRQPEDIIELALVTAAAAMILYNLWKMLPALQLISRLRMVYDSCSRDVASQSLFSREKPCSRADGTTWQVVWWIVLSILLMTVSGMLGGWIGVSTRWMDPGPIAVFLFAATMPLLHFSTRWIVDDAFYKQGRDGQARLEELVQLLASRSG